MHSNRCGRMYVVVYLSLLKVLLDAVKTITNLVIAYKVYVDQHISSCYGLACGQTLTHTHNQSACAPLGGRVASSVYKEDRQQYKLTATKTTLKQTSPTTTMGAAI